MGKSLTLFSPYSILTYDPPTSPIFYVGLYRQQELGASKSQSPQTILRESKSSADNPDKTPS